jgi:hypothetical protein
MGIMSEAELPSSVVADSENRELELSERARKIIKELKNGVEKSGSERFQKLMSDQIKKAEEVLAGKENPDEFDILVHIAASENADRIRENGFYAMRNFSTVFTDYESALETPGRDNDKCCFSRTDGDGLLDFEFYLSDKRPTNFVKGTRGTDWDVITMVVPREFHKGSTITHEVSPESLERVIPKEYILESSLTVQPEVKPEVPINRYILRF